jgi:hypothetical protein
VSRNGAGFIVVAGALLVLSFAVAAPAVAGFKTGKYEGTTTQGRPIGFKVTQLGVKKLGFTINVSCDDGTNPPFRTDQRAKAPISERGRFVAMFEGDITARVTGKVKRKHASGSIESSGTHPETGATCAGTTDWTADKLK